MTVCGYLLTMAGCEMVFPFALADSSENRGNQNAEVIFIMCSHLQTDASIKPYEPAEWSKLAQVLLNADLQPSDLTTLT